MKPCELQVYDIAFFARKVASASEMSSLTPEEILECESALAAAKAVAGNYTGLDIESVEFEDITYAVKVLAAEMIDNHQITAQYTGKNPVAMQILDLHSTNLLPSVEE